MQFKQNGKTVCTRAMQRYVQAVIVIGLVGVFIIFVSLATGHGTTVVQVPDYLRMDGALRGRRFHNAVTNTTANALDDEPVQREAGRSGGGGGLRGVVDEVSDSVVSKQPETTIAMPQQRLIELAERLPVQEASLDDFYLPSDGKKPPFHMPFPPTLAFRNANLPHYRMDAPSLMPKERITRDVTQQFKSVAADPEKRAAVREAMEHSWFSYRKFSWGCDTLKPVSKSCNDNFLHMHASMVDALSTLLVMGMSEEAASVVEYLQIHLSFRDQEDINLFETTIRVLGGLLSSYYLSDKQYPVLLDKAVELADELSLAFGSASGVPFGTLGFRSRRRYNPAWNSGGSTTSEVATLQLELEVLTFATGNPAYALLGRRVMSHLMLLEPIDGLYPIYVSPTSGEFVSDTVTFGARGDSLYEYLLKQYVLAGGLRAAETQLLGNPAMIAAKANTSDAAVPNTNPAYPVWTAAASIAAQQAAAATTTVGGETGAEKKGLYVCNDATLALCGNDQSSLSWAHPWFMTTQTSSELTEASWFSYIYGMYLRSMRGTESQLLAYSSPSRFAYLKERFGSSRFDDKMDHLVCFVPGMLALGSVVAPTDALAAEHISIAKQLMDTCIHMYDQTATRLAAEITRFPGGSDPVPDPGAKHNLLRPETVESLLILYRITGDETYRQAGWRIFTAFNTTSRVRDGGFSTIADVTEMPPRLTDNQESFWLAETLKYLYLLFSEDALVPLDKYVFNTEAHPLPILNGAR